VQILPKDMGFSGEVVLLGGEREEREHMFFPVPFATVPLPKLQQPHRVLRKLLKLN